MKPNLLSFCLVAGVAAHDHMYFRNQDSGSYQRKEAFQYVAQMCEDDVDNWCDLFQRNGDSWLQSEEYIYTIADCLSDQSLTFECSSAIANKNLEPVLQCSGDLLDFCAPSQNTDKASMIRCIRDSKSNFSTPCSAALQQGWAQEIISLNLESTENPSDYDVYIMLSVPDMLDRDNNRLGWGAIVLGLSLLLILIVSIIACIKCCKCCTGNCTRRRQAPIANVGSSSVMSAPYTGQGVHSSAASAQHARVLTAIPVSNVPANQSIYYAAPASAPPKQGAFPYAQPI